MGKYLATWTHDERVGRRKQMAVAVAEGESLGSVAGEFGVTTETVRKACHENGVDLTPRAHPVRFSGHSYRLIADLCNTSDSLREIAVRYGVTHQRVSEVYRCCLQAGIPVVVRSPGRKTLKPRGD